MNQTCTGVEADIVAHPSASAAGIIALVVSPEVKAITGVIALVVSKDILGRKKRIDLRTRVSRRTDTEAKRLLILSVDALQTVHLS